MKKIIGFLIWSLLPVYTYAQYYTGALGLNGMALRSSLHNIIKNHNAQNWPLWSHFASTDVKNGNTVWDIYSDIPGGTPPYVFTLVTNQCGTYTGEGQCYNHEHTWPSTFFNDGLPMKSDLHHVYPTDGWVNNKRSNNPYGEVGNTVSYTSDNGSKLGKGNTYLGYTDNLFEPIDSFKGDVARAYFYMSTRYYGEDAGWTNWTMANGANLTQDAIDLLLQWHHLDPVSTKEINRNDAVYAIQNNRNPFVDYPIFADCIWGTSDCTSLKTKDWLAGIQVKVYPNPCHDVIDIDLPVTLDIRQIDVYNTFGQHIETINGGKRINTGAYALGCYTAIIKTEKGNLRTSFLRN